MNTKMRTPLPVSEHASFQAWEENQNARPCRRVKHHAGKNDQVSNSPLCGLFFRAQENPAYPVSLLPSALYLELYSVNTRSIVQGLTRI